MQLRLLISLTGRDTELLKKATTSVTRTTQALARLGLPAEATANDIFGISPDDPSDKVERERKVDRAYRALANAFGDDKGVIGLLKSNYWQASEGS